jgi:hypothetical protein
MLLAWLSIQVPIKDRVMAHGCPGAAQKPKACKSLRFTRYDCQRLPEPRTQKPPHLFRSLVEEKNFSIENTAECGFFLSASAIKFSQPTQPFPCFFSP